VLSLGAAEARDAPRPTTASVFAERWPEMPLIPFPTP
jgi:hypothetical protein